MVYWPCATRSLVEELLLDFSLEADELPIEVDDALDADEVADWLKSAHGLIASKLTKKVRAELGL